MVISNLVTCSWPLLVSRMKCPCDHDTTVMTTVLSCWRLSAQLSHLHAAHAYPIMCQSDNLSSFTAIAESISNRGERDPHWIGSLSCQPILPPCGVGSMTQTQTSFWRQGSTLGSRGGWSLEKGFPWLNCSTQGWRTCCLPIAPVSTIFLLH